MNNKVNKKIITIQLPNDLYNKLAEEAEQRMLTLSAYIRLLLLKRAE